jgi:UDP-glucose 4-epimerase
VVSPVTEQSAAPSRRILITGLASVWGGRLAQALERDPGVETVVGIDSADPQHELERTEFVRTETDAALVVRIIRAAEIDTIVYTGLVSDTIPAESVSASGVQVSTLRNLLSAAGATDVHKLVVKTSAQYYGADRESPAFFTEDMRPSRAGSRTQRELIKAEQLLGEFALQRPDIAVTVLRCALPIGSSLRTPHLALLSLPALPSILGFDPRWQFVHEDDVVGALAHAVTRHMPGPFNLAGDGVLALSEVAGLLGKPLLPVLPPWGTLFAAAQMRRLGLRIPVAMIRDLRYGRGLDNRRLKASGYLLRYTSREAALKLRAQQRLRPLLGSGEDDYRYEREVEDFLRWSPSVQSRRGTLAATAPASGSPGGPASRLGPPGAGGYSDLTQSELIDLIPSLETETMLRLRRHEAERTGRPAVLDEIDHQLELRGELESG